jgi:hypothetical protein
VLSDDGQIIILRVGGEHSVYEHKVSYSR